MTEVKICGLTRPRDVDLACALGAAYLGFNFSALSPRRVTLDMARALGRATRSGVARVGVFVHESAEEIGAAVEAAGLDLVQIHRPLSARGSRRSPLPVIAVVGVSSNGADAAPPELLGALPIGPLRHGLAGPVRRHRDRLRLESLVGKTWPVPLFLAGGLDPGQRRRGDRARSSLCRGRRLRGRDLPRDQGRKQNATLLRGRKRSRRLLPLTAGEGRGEAKTIEP